MPAEKQATAVCALLPITKLRFVTTVPFKLIVSVVSRDADD